jgi:hypothetical protein
MRRLIQLDVVRAGDAEHHDAAVNLLVDLSAKLGPFRRELGHRRVEVVAHQRDRMVPRVVVRLALPLGVRRVHPQLARRRLGNQSVLKISQFLSNSSATYGHPNTSRKNARVAFASSE